MGLAGPPIVIFCRRRLQLRDVADRMEFVPVRVSGRTGRHGKHRQQSKDFQFAANALGLIGPDAISSQGGGGVSSERRPRTENIPTDDLHFLSRPAHSCGGKGAY